MERNIMPRSNRQISPNGVNHCIMRGINKQDIFLDTQDKKKFKSEIIKTKEKYKYKIYAYVIMPNHVHMIVKTDKNQLPEIMCSLLTRYSSYFNKKYERVGHVFQDRYCNKNIEDETYLKNAMQYIHFNPEKAGICKTAEYEYSSYKEYINTEQAKLTDVKDILLLYDSKCEKQAIEMFIKQNKEKQKEREDFNLTEYEMQNKLTDEQLINIIYNELKIDNIVNMQRIRKNYIKEDIIKILEIRGTCVNQISRVTGINRKIIQEVKNGRK
jgi:hypothetical protein